MALTVFITLTVADVDTGPFSLYSNADSFTSPFETNIAKSTLLAGYLSTIVPNFTTIIRVKSVGEFCSNYVDIHISGITTTTTTAPPTTTSTTTATPIVTTTTTSPPIVTTTTTTPGTTTSTTTAAPYCTTGCISYSATGEAAEGTTFWYIACDGTYTEQFIAFGGTFFFCACNKPDQYSTIDVTIINLGACA